MKKGNVKITSLFAIACNMGTNEQTVFDALKHFAKVEIYEWKGKNDRAYVILAEDQCLAEKLILCYIKQILPSGAVAV